MKVADLMIVVWIIATTIIFAALLTPLPFVVGYAVFATAMLFEAATFIAGIDANTKI